jgi:hypothetical protein
MDDGLVHGVIAVAVPTVGLTLGGQSKSGIPLATNDLFPIIASRKAYY